MTFVWPQSFTNVPQAIKKSSLLGGKKFSERCSRPVSVTHTCRPVGEFEDVPPGQIVLPQLQEVVWDLDR